MNEFTRHVARARLDLQAAVLPGNPDYARLRLGWNRAIDQWPAAITFPRDARDVAVAISAAQESGLSVAVQATGHGLKQPYDDALVINTSRMRGIAIDPLRRVARVEAGVDWAAVVAAAHAHGLAPLNGFASTVGVVGYTLGGGSGWLAREYGHAADSMRSIDVVTADGRLRHVDADHDPELFWALRGGGGGFGVVTAIEFDLYPVSHVYGGMMLFSIERASDVIDAFGEWTSDLPELVTSMLTFARIPAIPALPAALQGRHVVGIGAVVRDPEQGPRLIGPVKRQLGTARLIMDTFDVLPYSRIREVSNDPVEPLASHMRGVAIEEWSPRLADQLCVMLGRNSPLGYTKIEFRHLGGKIGRMNPDNSAVGLRSAEYQATFLGLTPTAEAKRIAQESATSFRNALVPFKGTGPTLNFVGPDTDLAEAFLPEQLARLAKVEKRYDPCNLFRYARRFARVASETAIAAPIKANGASRPQAVSTWATRT